MWYMKHHAIVVTGLDQDKLKEARKKIIGEAIETGIATKETIDLRCLVSKIVMSFSNGYGSFFIAPDGSKEGWATSDDGDSLRDKAIKILDSYKYDDGSSPFSWVEVQYGDEQSLTLAKRNSDGAVTCEVSTQKDRFYLNPDGSMVLAKKVRVKKMSKRSKAKRRGK